MSFIATIVNVCLWYMCSKGSTCGRILIKQTIESIELIILHVHVVIIEKQKLFSCSKLGYFIKNG